MRAYLKSALVSVRGYGDRHDRPSAHSTAFYAHGRYPGVG